MPRTSRLLQPAPDGAPARIRRPHLRVVPLPQPSAAPEPAGPVVKWAGPFLKWVGGKGKLLEHLAPLLPQTPHALRYAEPFLGGGALFFHLWSHGRIASALLTDVNFDLVNACTVLRDHPDALVAQLRTLEASYLGSDEVGRAALFYAVRDKHPALVPMAAVERAARMLFLNRTCFNGLWRENRRGLFNAPHGRYPDPNICPEAKLRAAHEALRQAFVLRSDFRRLPELCAQHAVDFVYLDPPYHPVSATSAFNAYSGGAFAASAQAELADVCRALDRQGVRFLLSNSDCAFVHGLYRGFEVSTVMAARAVNCKADRRGTVSEVVVRNYG